MISITRLCIVSLMSILVSNANADEVETRGKTEKCILQKVCSIDAKLCNSAIPISSADINKPGGYIISQPGLYTLCGDVNWVPSGNNTYGITVTNTSNVTIEGQGFTLKQTDPTKSACFPIFVTGNASDVNIQNFTISQGSGGAILLDSGSSCVNISGMKINRCCYNGMILLSNDPANPGATAGLFAAAIFLHGGVPGGDPTPTISGVTIQNCEICDTGVLGEIPVSFFGSILGNTLTLTAPPLLPVVAGEVISVSGANIATVTQAPANGTLSVGTQVLPTATFNVLSTAGFPTTGTLVVNSNTGPQTLTYTGVTSTSFTGVSGGTGSVASSTEVTSVTYSVIPSQTVPNIASVTTTVTANLPISSLTVTSTTGFPTTSGVIRVNTVPAQTLTYTGISGNVLQNVTGATANIPAGTSVSLVAVPMVARDPNGFSIPVGRVTAIMISSSTHVVVKNVIVNNYYAEEFSFGISIQSGQNTPSHSISISDSVFQGGKSYNLVKGTYIAFGNDVLKENIVVSDLTTYYAPEILFFSTPTTSGTGAEGTKCGGNNIVYRRCNFSGISEKTQTPSPLNLVGNNGNQSVGAVILLTDNLLMEDCIVQDVTNDGGQIPANAPYCSTSGYRTWFLTSNTKFLRCFAGNISTPIGYAQGFDTAVNNILPFSSNTDAVFTDCIAEEINITGSNGVFAAGFDIRDVRNQVVGCTVNRVLDLSVPAKLSPAAYGIVLDQNLFSAAANCTIKNNVITNCSGAAIFDTTVAKNSVISGNYAERNGTTVNGNYNNAGGPVSAWTPIRNWQVGSLPATTDNNGIIDPTNDNMNIYI